MFGNRRMDRPEVPLLHTLGMNELTDWFLLVPVVGRTYCPFARISIAAIIFSLAICGQMAPQDKAVPGRGAEILLPKHSLKKWLLPCSPACQRPSSKKSPLAFSLQGLFIPIIWTLSVSMSLLPVWWHTTILSPFLKTPQLAIAGTFPPHLHPRVFSPQGTGSVQPCVIASATWVPHRC